MRAGLLFLPLAIVGAMPASAQGIAVHDNAALLKLIDQVKTAGSQLQALEKTYNQAVDAYNNAHGLTNANGVANILNSDASRRWLPSGARDIEQLASGSTNGLGQIGQAAANIRAGRRVSLPDLPTSATDSDRATRTLLTSNGDRVATNAAVADAAFGATTTRTEGLEQLRQALSTASTQKEVQDLQARIAIEQAHIQNDAMQLQAVKMRQEAEDRLQGQQAAEQAIAERAADAARRHQ
ncbi:type IV secretion system protein VirB5 [Sphingomonas vulcanisoli]|uniref:Type IV secretion system protein VirB5 n=1 Tax=Sphingomonas vulcanisoli TaxID=1658060 RepID=A0ABX0TY10_9SPHN|nr:type IV secretion system protein [Sphingomonas vulcanisoli]NIJ09357.1 type IV secretion system protein VirB5 [Sphingomonas vulcanisoli]